MKEADKGYAEWCAVTDELAKIKRRFASLQIAMIVSLGVLIARGPEVPPRVTDTDLESARVCYLRNNKTEGRLDALERRVRVEQRSGCSHNLQAITCEIKPENAIHTIYSLEGTYPVTVVNYNGNSLTYDGTAISVK